MANLYSISNRANVNAYSYQDKYIFVYDDHRTLLNVLFEAKKLNSFPQTPNLIYFDRHDDACETRPLSGLLDLMGAEDLSTLTSKQFWSFVEFDLGSLDDDWLLTGMELDFDLDCFTTVTREKTHAWPEVIFKNEYVNWHVVRCFMQNLIRRSSLITICREPGSCGGIGEANKILHYLDKYFFDGNLNTIPVY